MLTHAKSNKKINVTKKKIFKKKIQYKIYDNKKGLGYIYFLNDESSIWTNSIVELSGSKNLKFIGEDSEKKIDIQINPKEERIVLFIATNLPYASDIQLLYTITNIKPKNKKKNKTIPKKLKIQNNKKVPKLNIINIKESKNDKGTCFEFENNTELVYQLNLEFGLINCFIECSEGNDPSFILFPKTSKTICVVPLDTQFEYSVNLIKMKEIILGC